MGKSGNKEIWAIGGGKGGVGKSLICCNLALELAQRGHTVVLIDADLGSANLHTCLGINSPAASLSDFINGKNTKLDSVLTPTPYANLSIVSGAYDVIEMANPKYFQLNKMTKAIRDINADYVLIDLGAGTSTFILDFFLIADKGILTAVPEPTSIENTYRFIKSAFYRKLKSIIHHSGVRVLLERMTTTKTEDNPRTPSELLERIQEISTEAGDTLQYELSNFVPKLLLNQVRNNADIRVGYSMRSACIKYFGIKIEFSGFMEHDAAVLQSIRVRQPLLYLDPYSKASRCVKKITENLLNNSQVVTTSL